MMVRQNNYLFADSHFTNWSIRLIWQKDLPAQCAHHRNNGRMMSQEKKGLLFHKFKSDILSEVLSIIMNFFRHFF